MNFRALRIAPVLGMAAALLPGVARADKITHPTAVFAGLDKITGRIISFDVAANETVQFGSLQITPRVCYTRPPTEAPQTDGFVEVDEVQTDNKFKRIFSGWMYAASPGLHGVEHPVYDVWLTDCKGGTQVIPETAALPGASPEDAAAAAQANQPPSTQPKPRAAARTPAAGKPPAGQPPAGLPPPQPVAGGPSRRSPIQSFFPTASNPGDSARERDLMH